MNEALELPREIRGVMLPVTGGRVLVPNTTMAEVISYAKPEPVHGAPSWLLGRLTWRGWGLPVLAFSSLLGVAGGGEATENARVAILKALSGHPRLPYFGVLSQGFPRLTLISEANMRPDEGADAEALPAGVREQVIVHDEAAWIPDLAAVESMLVEALTVAA
ncbi:MAG TPA: chemotaxis protein CheW [Rhodanobacteraceae bacterium]|jgi:chemosensory pili system protein ChpC|nr:chemotaxis protein CheW [Rhodanobacteraceae bacterium]